jgi:Septum formation
MNGRERDRYGRQDWREQLRDIPATIRAHPGIALVAIVFVALFLIQLLLRPTYVTVLEVAAGDCLYIRAGATAPGEPGADPTVAPFAESAGCDASHSHEVLWVMDLGLPGSAYPGDGSLAEPQAACDRTLSELRGSDPVDGFVATVIVPSRAAWDAGARAGVCVASRADGGFLDRPLRDLVPGAGRSPAIRAA